MSEYCLLKLHEVRKRTSLGKSTIYRNIKKGTFPPPRRVGDTMARWSSRDIDQWIEQQRAANQ